MRALFFPCATSTCLSSSIRANIRRNTRRHALTLTNLKVRDKVEHKEIFAVESYEKKFPCTVNIVLRERIETFTVKNSSDYSVYDERGKHIRNTESQPLNTVDRCPNILLECGESETEEVAALCEEIKNNFFKEKEPKALRRLVKSVKTDERLGFIDVTLNSGPIISVYDWKISGAQKIKKAYEKYGSLNEYQRICGTITVTSGKDSAGPVAGYGE